MECHLLKCATPGKDQVCWGKDKHWFRCAEFEKPTRQDYGYTT